MTDLVKFYLPFRYFQTRPGSNGMCRSTCVTILTKSFGLCDADWNRLMCEQPDGLWIVSRADQFGKFIVLRHDANECINGVKDLKCQMYNPDAEYDRIAHQFKLPTCTLKGIARALGYLHGDDSHTVGADCRNSNVTDVSKEC